MNSLPKLKFYMILGNQPTLNQNSGDKINEINLAKNLSKYFDIYYNNQKFDPNNSINYGLTRKIVEKPSFNFDIYYVRNNPSIFSMIPRNKTRLYFCTPYNSYIFKECDALITITKSWEKLLKYGKEFNWGITYPQSNMIVPKNILTIHQTIDPKTIFPNKSKIIDNLKYKLCQNRFLIGHFGRVVNSCYPDFFINVYKNMDDNLKDKIKVIFFGKIFFKENEDDFNDFEVVENIDHTSINNYINCCDLILYNQRDNQSDYCGSLKILEAIQCRKPILLPRAMAREEELGKDYPLFYSLNIKPSSDKNYEFNQIKRFDQFEVTKTVNIIEMLVSDKNFYEENVEYVKNININQYFTTYFDTSLYNELIKLYNNKKDNNTKIPRLFRRNMRIKH